MGEFFPELVGHVPVVQVHFFFCLVNFSPLMMCQLSKWFCQNGFLLVNLWFHQIGQIGLFLHKLLYFFHFHFQNPVVICEGRCHESKGLVPLQMNLRAPPTRVTMMKKEDRQCTKTKTSTTKKGRSAHTSCCLFPWRKSSDDKKGQENEKTVPLCCVGCPGVLKMHLLISICCAFRVTYNLVDAKKKRKNWAVDHSTDSFCFFLQNKIQEAKEIKQKWKPRSDCQKLAKCDT